MNFCLSFELLAEGWSQSEGEPQEKKKKAIFLVC